MPIKIKTSILFFSKAYFVSVCAFVNTQVIYTRLIIIIDCVVLDLKTLLSCSLWYSLNFLASGT